MPFTFVRIPGTHLTSTSRRLPERSPPESLCPISAGRFEDLSCNPPPEGLLPSSMQQGCFQSVYTTTSFPCRSWHTLARDTYTTEITIPIFRRDQLGGHAFPYRECPPRRPRHLSHAR